MEKLNFFPISTTSSGYFTDFANGELEIIVECSKLVKDALRLLNAEDRISTILEKAIIESRDTIDSLRERLVWKTKC